MARSSPAAERELAVRVGARIRHVRMIQRISQSKLAADIGICAGPLGWIESGRLGDLLLQAEQKAGKNQKAVNALKRGLRQNGVKLEGN